MMEYCMCLGEGSRVLFFFCPVKSDELIRAVCLEMIKTIYLKEGVVCEAMLKGFLNCANK